MGLSANVEGTAGNLAAITVLAKKESEFANSSSESNWEAYRGIGDFAKLGKVPLRAVAGTHAVYVHIATRADSGIKSIKDFKGKRIMYVMTGASLLKMGAEAILEAYKITDEVKALKTSGLKESVEALIEGRTDVMMYPSGAKGSLFIELATSTPTYFIPLDEAEVKMIGEKHPFLMKQVLPAGTYQRQDKDTQWIGPSTMTVTRDDIPESLVYAVTKTLWEHVDEFHTLHPAAQEWSISKVLQERTIPWHPGAIKYYKEKGLWTNELEELQRRFLAEWK